MIGTLFKTNYGNCRLIEYTNNRNVVVEFEDGTLVKCQYGNLIRGGVKNPNFPNVYGVGFVGEGRHPTFINKKQTKQYTIWKSMLERCYSEKYLFKRPSYR